METNRRTLLASAGSIVTALSGCVVAGSPPRYCDPEAPPPAGFRVVNRDATSRTVEIEVVRDYLVYVETVFAATYDLGTEGAAARVEVSDVVDLAGRHVVRARLAGSDWAYARWDVRPGGCTTLVVTVADGTVEVRQLDGVEAPPGINETEQ